jgi:hypothetical protein
MPKRKDIKKVLINRKLAPMRALAIAAACLLLAVLSYGECVTVFGDAPGVPTFRSSSRRIRFTSLQEGKPLGNVQVILYLKTDNLNPKLALTTDNQGVAFVPDLAPGHYRIVAIGPEHEFAEVYLEVTDKRRKKTNSFLLTIPPTFLPQKKSDIEAAPITEHIRELKGHVEDYSGAYVPGALVQVYRKDSQSEPVAIAKIKADNNSSFAAALAPGKYVVFVSSPAFVPKATGFEIGPEGEAKELHVLLKVGSC